VDYWDIFELEKEGQPEWLHIPETPLDKLFFKKAVEVNPILLRLTQNIFENPE
jgi:hypothetical protein